MASLLFYLGDNFLASATQEGLFVDAGWTVGIHKDDAIDYLNNYDKNPNKGFFKFEGSVILIHKDAKITLTNAVRLSVKHTVVLKFITMLVRL